MYCSFLLGFSTGLLLTHLLVTIILERHSLNEVDPLHKDGLTEFKSQTSNDHSTGSNHFISYNIILTSPGDLLKPLQETWVSEVKHVHYYISLKGETTPHSVISSPFVKSIADHLGYPLLATLKLVCHRERDIDFKWYALVSESTYLRVNEFEIFLRKINIPRHFALGSLEISQTNGRPLEVYCSEMAIFMNHAMMMKICPELIYCTKIVELSGEASELNKCISNITRQLMCSRNKLQDIFYHTHGEFSTDDLQLGIHGSNPNARFINSFVFYPLTKVGHFKHLHYHVLKIRFSKLVDEQERLLKHHTYIQLSKTFQKVIKISPLFPEPTGLVNITLQQPNVIYSLKKAFPSISFKNDNSRSPLQSSLQRVAYDLNSGIIELTSSSKGVHTITRKFFLPWSIRLVQQINYKTKKVNFIIGISPVSQSFQRFMWTFETSFLSRASSANRTSLLVVIFSNSKVTVTKKSIYAAASLTEMYKKKYPHVDIRTITTDEPPSWRTLLLRVSEIYLPYELVYIVTTLFDFSAQIIDTCISNSMEGLQVYFPMIFSPFDPVDYQKKRLMLPFATKLQIKNGDWLPPLHNIACVHVSDLINILNVAKIGTDISVLDVINNGGVGLKVFAAPDAGLVNMWRNGCNHDVTRPVSVFCDVFINSPICQCDHMIQ